MSQRALQWLYDWAKSLQSLLIGCRNRIPAHNQLLLGSTIGIAGIVATDFALGYQRWIKGNGLVAQRITHRQQPDIGKSFSLKQSTTTPSTFEQPTLVQSRLSFNGWIFQYFYQTRLNLYANVAIRCIDTYFLHYSRRNIPDFKMLGNILVGIASFLSMIDPPNLQRHRYVLEKLGVSKEDRKHLLFFSDTNIHIPYKNGTQIIEFIEVCCQISAETDSEAGCVALFWRLKGDKLGYHELGGDGHLNVEQFFMMIVVWSALKVHVMVHAYGEKIIVKAPTDLRSAEMKKIHHDFETAETSMLALNHVARYTVRSMSEYLSLRQFHNLACTNAMKTVWKHGMLNQTQLLSQLRVPRFMMLARKKLLRLFTVNELHKYYNFEAAFLCICVHGVDHWGGHDLKDVSAKLNLGFGIPDSLSFVTVYAQHNKPILRESRLKYLAKSKMLQQLADYLDSVDSELADAVNLINST